MRPPPAAVGGWTLPPLRALARLVDPAVGEEALRYREGVNPALRALLGLPPELPEPPPIEGGQSLRLPGIPPARAAVDPAERLQHWLPARDDLDLYLAAVGQLFDRIAEEELARGKVPREAAEVYRNALLATAWQESCWRHWERRERQLVPLRSSAGSVGLMQVNERVWRGVYDPDRLRREVAYNARAGNEILVLYLVDYAWRRGEHQATGRLENLARAAYSMYNGGPGALTRYRRPDAPPRARRVDRNFYAKYLAVVRDGPRAVRSCYAPS
ncbi:MAG: hypothetical protein KatS3mg124_2198 [Porticoccaceae bacterium]|nr:MAG: hypothetical protein KatS3mg124_2198 [Porticoccaceae bacterium]